MIATRTTPFTRLQAEELEPRVMLAGNSFYFDQGADPLASGGIFSTGSAGAFTGAVFSSGGGFSAAGSPTGGGFLNQTGFPAVAVPIPNGFQTASALPGNELSNATSFPTGLPLSDGVALPNGAGPSGVGLPDASSVGEVIALGGDTRTEALGINVTAGVRAASDSGPDSASGVGQMEITTGANTVGASILPTSGYSSRAGGSGGPVGGHAKPAEKNEQDSTVPDAIPTTDAALFENGDSGAIADIAWSIAKAASGQ